MNRFVLDASVALAWFIDPSVAPPAIRVRHLLLRGWRAVVPSLWRPEVANGFVVAQRRGILSETAVAQAYSELDSLVTRSIETLKYDLSIQRIVTTAQRFALTAYDATYLETALEHQLPIATLDRKLTAVAAKAGLSLIS